jgi:hypothetical protein
MLYKTNSYKYRLTSTVSKEFFGANFDKIVTITESLYYDSDKVSLPKAVETTNVLNGTLIETKKTNIYYPSNVSELIPYLVANENDNIASLQTNHNVAQIIRTENLLGTELLETKQFVFGSLISPKLPSAIKSAKGAGQLEERVVFHSYNGYGNPTVVSLKDGSKTAYVYNGNQQVLLKIENYDSAIPLDNGTNTGNCFYQIQYPTSLVTQYNYDSTTKQLISIVDPKCDLISFNYDTFGRLKNVKDKEGNILSENEYHFKL